MGLATYGTMGVDWEERIRFDRLRDERLARIKALLKASDIGALLCFDMTNVRYITATHIGTSSSRAAASPRSKSLRSSSGVNVGVKSRFT